MKFIAKKGADKIEVEVLADGSFKVSTDKISAVNHVGAEGLIKLLIAQAGGEAIREAKQGHQHHTHSHNGVEHSY